MRLMKSFKFFLLAVAVIAFTFYYLDYDYSGYTDLAKSFYTRPFKIKVYNQTVKHILFWTNFYHIPLWDMKKETYDQEDLKSVNCPVTNCILTHKKDYLSDVEDYDALIFHIGSEAHFQGSSAPSKRNPGQIYIVALKEPPNQINFVPEYDANFFNLTMSYRLDSDILWTYGEVRTLETDQFTAPMVNPKWRDANMEFSDPEFLEIVSRKTKNAAQFVSHCGAVSKRDEIVKKLQNLGVEIDVYGSCGNLTCPVDSEICDQMLDSTYKFYFAFENNLCTDYLTEKLYRTMSYLALPVILSGVNYTNFLPPNSYIDANSFNTTEELASHLKFLASNPAEIVKHFYWKKYYKVVLDDRDVTLNHACNICKKMNDPNLVAKKTIYENPVHWASFNVCRPVSIKI